MTDTNCLMRDYKAIEKLWDKGENEVYICSTVLSELDNHKKDEGINGYNVRKSIRWMDSNEDKFKFVISDYFEGINDDKIIASAKENDCIVVSMDINVRLKCKAQGIEAQDYNEISDISLGELRKGKHIIRNNYELLAKAYEGTFELTNGMYANDFVLFYDNEDLKDIFQIKNGKLVKPKIYDKTFSGASPRSLEQKLALTLLADQSLELVSFSGQFGSSKSFLQLGMALELIDKGKYQKLYIAKAPIALDKSLMTGYKPSDHISKMELPLVSVTSNLKNLRGHSKFNQMYSGFRMLEEYINQGIIEVLSIEDILGASLAPNSIMLVEEAMILDHKVTRAVYSRLGSNSVIFANGDLGQSAGNNLSAEDTGFFKIINIFAGYEKSAHLTLENIERSGFVAELAERWDKLK